MSNFEKTRSRTSQDRNKKERENARIKSDPHLKEKVRELYGNRKDNQDGKGKKENNHEFRKEQFEDINNPFSRDFKEPMDFDSDFYYLVSGLDGASIRLSSEKGYSIDIEAASRDWLQDGIKPALDNEISKFRNDAKPVNVVERPGRNTYRIDAYCKSLAQQLHEHQNNSNKLDNMTPEQQLEWANGLFDSHATVDATEFKIPTIQMPNEDQEKLVRFQNIISGYGIESDLETPEGKNPRLQIRGADNFRKLNNTLNPRHPEKAKELNDIVGRAERYESPERKNYVSERQNLGYQFQHWMNDYLEFIRPDSDRLPTNNMKDSHGNKKEPDFAVRNPNGEKEIIEAKLTDENIEPKDEEYASDLGFDSTHIYRFEGDERPSTYVDGKENRYGTREDLEKAMKDALKEAKTEDEKTKIQKGIDKLKELVQKAEGIREKYSGRKSSAGKNKSRNQNSEKNPEKPKEDDDDDKEDNGDGGKEQKYLDLDSSDGSLLEK
ncbi:MAG: hypothetical protein HZR80_19015 [Candidatus Heimdallarchaeota archaeon]